MLAWAATPTCGCGARRSSASSARGLDRPRAAHRRDRAEPRPPEFFIRKAIGWALRDYAWTDPAWVVAFVGTHADLSALSRREALKNLSR